ncbi:MAG: hypothetical protein QOG42_1046 [Solirubrobacteraceae bacterium]|jgi:hypothetical protein|nr:hypothetical protein [Solirubrobacteraceae bacterium]
MAAAQIDFVKGEARRYRAVLHRPDGVVVAFDGGAYDAVGGGAGELPHDIAQLVVEDELGLRSGVWGVLVAGGMLRHAAVVGGRRAPHATRHGRQVIARAGDRIVQAEMLTEAVCNRCAADAPADPAAIRRAVGERWWAEGVTRTSLERARQRLRDGAAQWAELFATETLTAAWRLPPA